MNKRKKMALRKHRLKEKKRWARRHGIDTSNPFWRFMKPSMVQTPVAPAAPARAAAAQPAPTARPAAPTAPARPARRRSGARRRAPSPRPRPSAPAEPGAGLKAARWSGR